MADDEPKRKRATKPKKPVVNQAKDPSRQPGELRRIGGSMSDDWNNRIANDTVSSLWLKNSDEATRDHQLAAARLRHIAGTRWSTKRYLNMELLRQQNAMTA